MYYAPLDSFLASVVHRVMLHSSSELSSLALIQYKKLISFLTQKPKLIIYYALINKMSTAAREYAI